IQKIAVIVIVVGLIFSAVWVLARTISNLVAPNEFALDNASSGKAVLSLESDDIRDIMYIGETRNINIYLNSAGDDVVAVKAVITYDENIFIADKLSLKNSVFQTTAKQELTPGKIELILGAPGDGAPGGKGFTGDKGLVASFQVIAKNESVGKEKIMFGSDSRVIKDDANASDILKEVKGYEWKVSAQPSANLKIDNGPTYILSKQANNTWQAEIKWDTNISATSEVCWGATKDLYDIKDKDKKCKSGNQKSGSGKTRNHLIIIPNLTQNQKLYFQVKSTAEEIPLQSRISPLESLPLFKGEIKRGLISPVHAAQTETAVVISDVIFLEVTGQIDIGLSIQNLSAIPSYTSAIISWNTQGGSVKGLTDVQTVKWTEKVKENCPTNYIYSQIFSTNPTSVHTYKITGLSDNKNYCVQVTSGKLIDKGTDTESATDTIEFTTKTGKGPDANIILKVERDRICDKWLGCRSSIQVINNSGQEEKLCFDVGLCDELGPDGGCALSAKYPDSQMTFNHPESISAIENLSGLAKPGLVWNDKEQINGYFAYSNMTPIGEDINIPNGNFESGEKWPWFSENNSDVWVDRDISDPTNHILYVNYGDSKENYVSADVPIGWISTDYEYAISLRLKTSEQNLEYVRVQLYIENGSKFYPINSKEKTEFYVNDSWKKLVLNSKQDGSEFKSLSTGVISGEGILQIMIPIPMPMSGSESKFGADDFIYIDDISMKSVLPITIDESIARECRLYPNNNSSLACEYTDLSGKQYQGWYGFCVEDDPKYKNTNPSEQMCLNWWPVDILPGETSIFGTDQQAGYIGRSPLYYCLESSGSYPYYKNPISGWFEFKDKEHSGSSAYSTQSFGSTNLSSLKIYRDEILEVRIKNIQMDNDNHNYHDDCELQLYNDKVDHELYPNPAEICSSRSCKGAIIFNEKNKEGWNDNFTYTSFKVGDYYTGTINPYAYLRCGDLGDDNKANVITAKLNFNDYDMLESVTVKYRDGSDHEGSVKWDSIQITFLGERCNVLAQVVKPGGENMAWASKIKGGTKTSNWIKANGNLLEYPFSQDYYPYGASVVDSPISDPGAWDKALYVMPADNINFYSPPYQVRAGSPYAISNSGFGKCSNNNIDCKRDGDCIVQSNPQGKCYDAGLCEMLFSECDNDDECKLLYDQTAFCEGSPGGYCVVSDLDCAIADDDCLFDIDAGICEFDNLSIGTAQCVAGSAEKLGQQCDSIANCGYNTSLDNAGSKGLCMGINLTPEQEKYIGGGWQAGEQKLSQLFAKSYDVWEWQWVAGSEGNP
ncbi:hypothetical protein KKC16_01155, partial [Patescibacteria group bacterium]|nr:hypothetical protein [Patescibacteria group bacterium]